MSRVYACCEELAIPLASSSACICAHTRINLRAFMRACLLMSSHTRTSMRASMRAHTDESAHKHTHAYSRTHAQTPRPSSFRDVVSFFCLLCMLVRPHDLDVLHIACNPSFARVLPFVCSWPHAIHELLVACIFSYVNM